MEVPAKKARVLRAALETWRREGRLSEETARSLEADIRVILFDWRRLARYALFASVLCLAIAVGAILADEVLMEFLLRVLALPPLFKCVVFFVLGALFFAAGVRRRARTPERIYSIESLFFLGVLSVATGMAFLGMFFGSERLYPLLPLGAALLYGALGIMLESNQVWAFALLSLGGWMGAETGYASGWGAYYLGMNYPLRFVLFGAVLTGLGYAMGQRPRLAFLGTTTRTMGFLYLFLSLWILSIFGNYGDAASWFEVRQMELFHWSLLFGIVAAGAVYRGLKRDDGLARGFGTVFLCLNFYTRFFEYFWAPLHKALFFALLAASFWLLGSKAERIWSDLRRRRSARSEVSEDLDDADEE